MVLLVVTSIPFPAVSHPHAWIDLTVRLQIDDDRTVGGAHIDWLFDEIYSLYSISDFEMSEQGIESLAQETLNNLIPYGHFSNFSFDGEPVATGAVTEFDSKFIGGRWWLTFYLPFTQKLRLNDGELSYRIYDPTYYVEILHAKPDRPVDGLADLNCTYDVVPPNPSPELSALAAALDRGRRADGPIGRAFSEQVSIRCD